MLYFQRLLGTYTIGHTTQDSYTVSNDNIPELQVLLDAIKTDSLKQVRLGRREIV